MIEKQLNIVPPRENPTTRPRTYDDDRFGPSRTRTRTNDGFDEGSSVPARDGTGTGTRRSGTGSVIDDQNFSRPSIRNGGSGSSTDTDRELFRENTTPRKAPEGTSADPFDAQKVNTEKVNTEEGGSAKAAGDADVVIPPRKPAPTGSAVEDSNGPQTLRLDSRITSKAVSPRQRQTILVEFQKPVVSQSKPQKSNWISNSELVQKR